MKACLIASVAAACAAWAAADEPALDAGSAFTQADRRVDIGGGRKLNLHCTGSGSPTVVFESRLGLAGWDWVRVQPAVAQRTRACTYDRAGLGFSDFVNRPSTSRTTVDDLHRLLGAAGVAPPYVLVGAAEGALAVRLFQSTYPAEVRGLVLVDGMPEDLLERGDAVTNGAFGRLRASAREDIRTCAAAAHAGMEPGQPDYRRCAMASPYYGPALAEFALHDDTLPAVWDTTALEWDGVAASAEQVRASRQPLGDLPLESVGRALSPYAAAGKPPSDNVLALEAEAARLRAQVAALSRSGRDQVIPGAHTTVQLDHPQAVIDAVNRVLDRVH